MTGKTSSAANNDLTPFDQPRVLEFGLKPGDQVLFTELEEIRCNIASLFFAKAKIGHLARCIIAVGIADP